MTHPHFPKVLDSIQTSGNTAEPRIPPQIRRSTVAIRSRKRIALSQCQVKSTHLQEGPGGQKTLQNAFDTANNDQSTCNSTKNHTLDYKPRPLKAYYLSTILVVLLMLVILTEVAVYELPDGTKSPSFRSEVHYQNSTAQDELDTAYRRRGAPWSEVKMYLPKADKTRYSTWNHVQGGVLETGTITKTSFILSSVISAKSSHPRPLITAGVLWPNITSTNVKNQTLTINNTTWNNVTAIPNSITTTNDDACYDSGGPDYDGLYLNPSSQLSNGTIDSSSTRPTCTSQEGYAGEAEMGGSGDGDSRGDYVDPLHNTITWSTDTVLESTPTQILGNHPIRTAEMAPVVTVQTTIELITLTVSVLETPNSSQGHPFRSTHDLVEIQGKRLRTSLSPLDTATIHTIEPVGKLISSKLLMANLITMKKGSMGGTIAEDLYTAEHFSESLVSQTENTGVILTSVYSAGFGEFSTATSELSTATSELSPASSAIFTTDNGALSTGIKASPTHFRELPTTTLMTPPALLTTIVEKPRTVFGRLTIQFSKRKPTARRARKEERIQTRRVFLPRSSHLLGICMTT